MLALDLCRSGADDEKILQWLEESTPELRADSLLQLRELRNKLSSRDMDDDDVTVAGLCVADGPREAFEVVRWQRRPDRRAALVSELVHRRTPAWCNQFVQIATTNESGAIWWLTRQMVRDGLAERPQGNYLAQMLPGLTRYQWNRDSAQIVEALRADPGLMEHEVWELLATEGLTRRLGDDWCEALVALAADGHRARLLDCAWHALVTDWRPVDQKPLLDILAGLEPTEEELTARLGGLLRMTASDNGPVVLWALAALRALLEADVLELDELLTVTAPLLRRDKRSAYAHLGLLELAAKRHPDRGEEIAAVASTALEHERTDVRERAEKLLKRIAPREVPERVEVQAVEEPPLPRPEPAPFEPIATADELVEVLLALLAGPGTALDCERSFDAAVRLRGEVSDAGRKALQQAVAKLTWNSRVALGAAVIARELADGPGPQGIEWQPVVYDTDPHETDLEKRQLRLMVELRVAHVQQAMRSPVTRLLSTPTTVDGTLSVADLEERLVRAQGEPALRTDVGTAAFRIHPSEYADVDRLRVSTIGSSIAKDVARIAGSRPTWQAVPYEHERQAWMRDRDVSIGAGLVWQDATPEPDPADEFVGSVLDRRDMARRGDAELRASWDGEHTSESQRGMWPLMLPHHRELLAAHAHPVLAVAVTSKYATSVPLILGLGGGTSMTGPVACSALAVALTAEAVAHRAAATDALIELATYGCLDGEELGRQTLRVLEGPNVVGTRIADGLGEAGRALGPLAAPVLDAHVALFPVLRDRRDGHAFAETAADLATSLGRKVVLPPGLAELADGRSSSALARAVRRMPRAAG